MQHQFDILRIDCRRIVLPVILLLTAFVAVVPADKARADYSPSRLYTFTLGTGGTLIYNHGTALNAADIASAWNSWTGTSYLSVTTNPSTCGSSKSCV